jgi:hypothetical protein
LLLSVRYRELKNFADNRKCRIQEKGDGLLINLETNQPFSYKDSCVERGPHLGYDPVASEAARAAVQTVLKSVFKLD